MIGTKPLTIFLSTLRCHVLPNFYQTVVKAQKFNLKTAVLVKRHKQETTEPTVNQSDQSK